MCGTSRKYEQKDTIMAAYEVMGDVCCDLVCSELVTWQVLCVLDKCQVLSLCAEEFVQASLVPELSIPYLVSQLPWSCETNVRQKHWVRGYILASYPGSFFHAPVRGNKPGYKASYIQASMMDWTAAKVSEVILVRYRLRNTVYQNKQHIWVDVHVGEPVRVCLLQIGKE